MRPRSGAVGLAVVTLAPILGLLGQSLRVVALGVVLAGTPGRTATTPVNQPQVRRMS